MNALERDAASVVVIGFEEAQINDEHRAQIRNSPYAGFVLFARNLPDLQRGRALCDDLRACYGRTLPPILALDHEGGRVLRLREGLEALPSAMALGALDDPTLVRRAGQQAAFDMRRLGCNLNFAPVLDLALDARNTVIGTRSFGSDPAHVTRVAAEFARGLNDGGIVATYKHFPGHGATAIDSHLELPRVDASASVLRARDLAPFTALLPSAAAVMSAHVVMSAFDAALPATLSAKIMSTLLRTECGFRGVAFTDALEMKAISAEQGVSEGAVAALAAGNDAIVVVGGFAQARVVIQAIRAAVDSGRLDPQRLREAATRVEALRRGLCSPLPLDATSPHPGIARQLARQAICALGPQVSLKVSEVAAVSFFAQEREGAVDIAASATLASRVPQIKELMLPLAPSAAQTNAALESIVAWGLQPLVSMRRAHLYPEQMDAVGRVLALCPNAVLVSLLEPYDVLALPSTYARYATFGDDEPAIAGLSDIFFAGATACGQMRVTP